MSCCDYTDRLSAYPNPTDRTSSSGPRPINADAIRRRRDAEKREGGGGGGGGGGKGSGYRRFYSAWRNSISQRISDAVADPASQLRPREVVTVALAAYTVWRAVQAAIGLYALVVVVVREPLTLTMMLCPARDHLTLLGCAWRCACASGKSLLGWVVEMGTWQLVGLIVVAVAEEVWMKVFSTRS